MQPEEEKGEEKDEENGTYFDLIFDRHEIPKKKEGIDELELGSVEPEAFKLKIDDFESPTEYVK